MKIADLYIRVSTDEQADKGYSQRDQEERLRKYCEINHIQVRKVIYEDHSAKTFKRPSWTKLLGILRKSRGQSDLILFTKWDRFNRNAGDAYQIIGTLRRLGVELVYRKSYARKEQAALDVFQWIETIYNRTRRHSALGNLTIVEFEKLNRIKNVA